MWGRQRRTASQVSLAGTRVTRERPEATGQEGFPLPTQREGLGVQCLCRLPREGPARPQAPPPTAPARERQVREGPHGERPHHTTVHRPEGGTGRPCLSNEAESLTALLGTATPCQGPGHRPGAMERAEQGPPQPPASPPCPSGSGKRGLRPQHQELGGPGGERQLHRRGTLPHAFAGGDTGPGNARVGVCARDGTSTEASRDGGQQGRQVAKPRGTGSSSLRGGADARQHP